MKSYYLALAQLLASIVQAQTELPAFPRRHLLQVPRSPDVIARCDASRASAMCPAYKRAGGTCCRCPDRQTSLPAVMRHALAQCAPLTSGPAAHAARAPIARRHCPL